MRKAPFPIALVLLLTAVTFTLLSIYLPSLIHVVSPTPGPLNHEVKYGLYRRCVRRIPEESLRLLERTSRNDLSIPRNITRLKEFMSETQAAVGVMGLGDIPVGDGDGWTCQPFPYESECRSFGKGFCIRWATAGYAAQLSLFPCLVSLLTLLLITIGVGNKRTRAQRRRGGWKIVSGLMSIHSLLQIVSIGIVLHVYRTDDRFSIGSHLDIAADLGVTSAVISILIVAALTIVGLAAEAGQEWAGGKPIKKRKVHRRTRSGRVVQITAADIDEETGLLSNSEDVNGTSAATGNARGT